MADLQDLLRAVARQRQILSADGVRASGTALARLGAQIEALCKRIEQADTPITTAEAALASALRGAAAQATHDLGLLLAGLREAEALVNAARSAAELRVYGPDGAAAAIGFRAGQVEKRG